MSAGIELVHYVAVSVDGFVATADGGVGWLDPFLVAGEDHGYAEFIASIDAVVMGSRTYEQVLGFGGWPYAKLPSLVLSKRALPRSRRSIELFTGTPREALAELAGRGCARAWLVGGAAVTDSFRREGLVTEYVLSIVPVVLGDGIPLFRAPGPREALELADARSFATGLVQLRYRRRDDA